MKLDDIIISKRRRRKIICTNTNCKIRWKIVQKHLIKSLISKSKHDYLVVVVVVVDVDVDVIGVAIVFVDIPKNYLVIHNHVENARLIN